MNDYTESAAPHAVEKADRRDVTVTENGVTEGVTFSRLPLGRVRALSWLKNQLQLQADHVTRDFETLSPDCKSKGADRSAWLGGTGESWERGPYYVRGLVAMAYVLDDPELKAMAQKWIDWTLESQSECGAFGPFSHDPDNLDYWAVMPMLHTLTYYYEATGDERVIAFMTHYFAWEIEALKARPLTSWAVGRAGDNIYSAWWLYRQTGDAFLLDLCALLYSQTFDWDGYYNGDVANVITHIVNVHQSFKLFPLMYAITGNQHYLDTYYAGIDNLYMASGRQDGMSNGDEQTGDISSTGGNETCAVAERMLCDEMALEILKDATIADHLENITYNAWPQQLLPDGRGQVYFTMQNQIDSRLGYYGFASDEGDRLVYGIPGGYPCCIHNYQMAWPLFVSTLWYETDDGGVAAGAYGPNTVTATVGNGTSLTLTETTNYPYEETVTLILSLDKTDTFPLYVRIPEWCRNARVEINGHAVDGKWTAGEYVKLEAAWQDGDTVTLTFPQTLRVVMTENQSISVRMGAVLYALTLKENRTPIQHNPNGWNLIDGYTTYEITTDEQWNYALHHFNFEDVASNFKVTRKGMSDDMRFVVSDAPVILETAAVRINNWHREACGKASITPPSPIAAENVQQGMHTVRLIPYAFTRMRLTILPWTGDHTITWVPDVERPCPHMLRFTGVVGTKSADGQMSNATLTFDYKVEQNLTLRVTVNNVAVGTVELAAGMGTAELVTTAYQSMYYNKIELSTADGTPMPDGLILSLTVIGHA